MEKFRDQSTSFLLEAINQPAIWGFWDWVGYSAALIACGVFLWRLIQQAMKVLKRTALWSGKKTLIRIKDRIKNLSLETQETLLWSEHNHRMIAWVSSKLARAVSLMGLGIVASVLSYDPLNWLLGLPLIGNSILLLNAIRRRVLVVINYKVYVEHECKEIELLLNKAENNKYIKEKNDTELDEVKKHIENVRKIVNKSSFDDEISDLGLKPALFAGDDTSERLP